MQTLNQAACWSLFLCGVIAKPFGGDSATMKPDLPVGAAFPYQSPVAMGDRIYVVREQTVWEYDDGSGAWTDRRAPLPLKRHHFGVAAANGKVYVIGGCTGETETDPHNPVSNVDEFDTATARWTARASLPEPRRNLATVVIGGRVFVVGGSDASSQPKPVLVYDPVRNQWAQRKAICGITGCWGAHLVGGKIYALGMKAERDPAAYPFRTEEYDPVADVIASKKPIESPRAGFASASVDGIIYAIGGVGRERKPVGGVDAYDPATDTWKQLPALTQPRSWIGTITFKNAIYLLGGVADRWDSPEKSFATFFPTR